MIIVERKAMVGAAAVGTGAYGLGLVKPTPAEGPGKLVVYDVSGAKIAETATEYDAKLLQPVPLQVVTQGGPTKLYLAGTGWRSSRRSPATEGSGASPSASSTR